MTPEKGSPTPATPDYRYNVDQRSSVNAFFDVDIAGESVRLQITSRFGTTAEQIHDTVEALITAYTTLRTEHPKPEKPLPPVADKPQEHPAPEGESKKWERRPVPFDDLPPELQVGEAEGGPMVVFREDFDWCVVEPQPDEKSTVKFWREGMKYPVGAPINKWKHQNIAQALAPLGDIDPDKAQKVAVPGTQFYKDGREYTSENGTKRNYKDLLLVVRRDI